MSDETEVKQDDLTPEEKHYIEQKAQYSVMFEKMEKIGLKALEDIHLFFLANHKTIDYAVKVGFYRLLIFAVVLLTFMVIGIIEFFWGDRTTGVAFFANVVSFLAGSLVFGNANKR